MQLAENLVVAGRFRLNHLLGRGGMGSVWHATHLGLDVPCAVKFIEGEYAGLAEAQARFEREAKAAASLRSPNVVQILDHGVWENTPYIAMELLDGEDLGKRLQKVGVLSPHELGPIVQQVCRALTKAHAAGIVHRDLKPDNVFLVVDDDREIVKVLDFGIAKKSQTGQLDSGSNTKTGAMLGTPYYMSPEQAQGIKSVDARSDLWSLAVIVYQALTGKLPFESEALGDLLVKIIVAPIPTPSQVARVPPQFDRWWARAADRDPNKRFQTAKELAESLSAVLGQPAGADVMERPNFALAGTAVMPNASTPRPAYGSAPNVLAATPQPASGAMTTPNPLAPMHAHAPGAPGHVAVHPAQGAPAVSAVSTTGALSRSYGEPAAPKKSNAAIFAVVGVLAVVALGGGGYAMMAHGKRAAASGEGTAGAAPTVTAAPAASATGAPTAAALASPPADPVSTVAPAPSTSAAPSASVASAPPPAAPAHHAGAAARPASAPPPAKPAGTAAAPAAPAKKSDLGF